MAEHNFTEIIKHVAIAGTGGAAKYLNEYIKGNPFNWKICAAKFVVCGFIGLVFSLFFSVYKSEFEFVATALAGYAVTEIFDALVIAVAKATGRSVLGVELKIKPEPPAQRKRRARAK